MAQNHERHQGVEYEPEQNIPRAVEPPFRPSFLPAAGQSTTTSSGARYVNGIELISTRQLPDHFRSIFHFPNFNAAQSKCFNTVFRTNDNFVLSSPTGSGKTAVFELAICRLINVYPDRQFKVVYQAPTKSLCAERQRDWERKFRAFDVRCAELTGDTDQLQMRSVQSASIIITTPEKWDSVTRKWKDHAKLMQLIKLFLIDEVHMLKEERGATLEAIVSRMKSIGSDVRYLALSATIPNSEDIAEWLGKDPINQHLPAPRERFGEEFRPVLLQRHVCGYSFNGSDFALNRILDTKLPDIISKYSQKKPIIIFCFTRKDTASTARALANWWSTKSSRDRYWKAPLHEVRVLDNDLKRCVSAGVAFHHAGMPVEDREAVADGYLRGNINVICCTSTLAVGVNLPCHFVIIKNTVVFTDKGLREYSDLEIMQMLGRAGRPQFDKNAVAVIVTRQEKVRRYELMMSGQEVLESRLHQNLIDHLNAEINLGTIQSLSTARKWLGGTFLSVRMKRNPEHYRLEGDNGGTDINHRLDQICGRDISLLRQYHLIEGDRRLKSTEYGEAMARYCVQFETAKAFLNLPPRAKLSEILSAIAQASEFKDIRFRSGEKQAYKNLNKSPMIKFPIRVNLDLPAHKVSLIIQSQLGSVDLPLGENDGQNKLQYNTEVNIIFQHLNRLIRCIIDFQLCTENSVTLRNALMLCRSVGGRCWDDSSLTLKQVEGIGPVGVRKLVNANIRSIEELANTETHKIEMVLGHNPPFGMRMLDRVKAFPVLKMQVALEGRPLIKAGQGATVQVKAHIGFMNEKPPETYMGNPVYLIFMAETSDSRKAHFARISARKVGNGQEIPFKATVTDPVQSIICHVMCEELAGTLRSASVTPSGIPSIAWPKPSDNTSEKAQSQQADRIGVHAEGSKSRGREVSEDFGVDGLDDEDFYQAAEGAGDLEFPHIDTILDDENALMRQNTAANSAKKRQHRVEAEEDDTQEEWQPKKLPNGKWACNHKCKDKTSCKHLCCREGADKPPKPPKKGQKTPEDEVKGTQNQSKNKVKRLPKGQTRLNLPTTKNATVSRMLSSESLPEVDLTRPHPSINSAKATLDSLPKALKDLERLHSTIQRGRTPPRINLPKYGSQNQPTAVTKIEAEAEFRGQHRHGTDLSTDYEESWPQESSFAGRDRDGMGPGSEAEGRKDREDSFGDHDSLLDEALVGLEDSQNLQMSNWENGREADATYECEKNETLAGASYEGPGPSFLHQAPSTSRNSNAAKDVAEGFWQLPTLSEVIEGKRPLRESSSLLFVPPDSPKKRKGDYRDPLQTPEKNSKRSRHFSKLSKENVPPVEAPMHSTDVHCHRDSDRDAIAEEKEQNMEDIESWILQEFGKYVEFA